MRNQEFAPPLHIIPLNRDNKLPVAFLNNDSEGTLAAVTENGRVSFFPLDINTVIIDGGETSKTIPVINAIASRMEQNFPDDKDSNGNRIMQYLAVGIMDDNLEQDRAKFIYEVCGFNRCFAELDSIYNTLASLSGLSADSNDYIQKEAYLSSEPMGSWIDRLIAYLKDQLNWREYVKNARGQAFQDEEDELDSLIKELLHI